MKSDFDKVVEVSESLLHFVLNIAETALEPKRFRRFKQLTFEHFHNNSKPKLQSLLRDKDQVRAVPCDDNVGKKGGRL